MALFEAGRKYRVLRPALLKVFSVELEERNHHSALASQSVSFPNSLRRYGGAGCSAGPEQRRSSRTKFSEQGSYDATGPAPNTGAYRALVGAMQLGKFAPTIVEASALAARRLSAGRRFLGEEPAPSAGGDIAIDERAGCGGFEQGAGCTRLIALGCALITCRLLCHLRYGRQACTQKRGDPTYHRDGAAKEHATRKRRIGTRNRRRAAMIRHQKSPPVRILFKEYSLNAVYSDSDQIKCGLP